PPGEVLRALGAQVGAEAGRSEAPPADAQAVGSSSPPRSAGEASPAAGAVKPASDRPSADNPAHPVSAQKTAGAATAEKKAAAPGASSGEGAHLATGQKPAPRRLRSGRRSTATAEPPIRALDPRSPSSTSSPSLPGARGPAPRASL